jgi:zinc/manganese transport system ATP-binding protein
MKSAPVLQLTDAALAFGRRPIWSELDLAVLPGEFVAVLGANGSGKTSLMRAVLGLQPLTAGRVDVAGRPVRRGSSEVGYVPQQHRADPLTPMRARDFVAQGLTGHRWGTGLPSASRRRTVAAALHEVGAAAYADAPIGQLSGGEQQRVRIAQALVTDPMLLLCDEPLLSLDLAHQRTVTDLIEARRRSADTAVLFVTHEINPVLPLVDRVLYLVDGRFRIGPPAEVMTSEVLSELYRTDVDVLHVRGRIVVVGAEHHAEHCHPGTDDGS